MKKLLFCFLAILTIGLNFTASAQRVTTVSRNGDEKFAYNLTTTDSAFHYVDSVIIKNNEGGIIEVTCIGYAKDTNHVVTGLLKVRFNKHRGTLTMGTIIEDMAVVTDTPLGTATWTLVAANNKIYVRVKGKDGYNITWTTIIKRKTMWY